MEEARRHFLSNRTSAEPPLQAEQLQQETARLRLSLNEKVSHQPGSQWSESTKAAHLFTPALQATSQTEFTKASGEKPSHDDWDVSLGPVPRPPETPAGRAVPPAAQIPPATSHLQPVSGSFLSLKLTNGAKEPNQRTKVKPKSNLSSAQRHKKLMVNEPKIKKLKYHEYIPPEQKGDKQPPPVLDSSFAKILQQQQQQQQQLFLQFQILSEQQRHKNCHQILPSPSTSPVKDQLDEMKVAQLKSELKLRSLPTYGTKNDLVERLRAYKEEVNGGCDITPSPAAGGTTGPGAGGAGKSFKAASANATPRQQFQRSSLTHQSDVISSAAPPRTTQQLVNRSGTNLLAPTSLIPFVQQSDRSFTSDTLGEMISSPLTHLSLQACSVSRLPADTKEEPPCSTPTPCQFSLKPASLQKQWPVSSAAHATGTTAPALTVDKDKMLQDKDKQIEELTRKLRQKQKLVEMLKVQLENGKKGGRVPDPVILVRVKNEPPDVPLTYRGSPLSSPQSSMGVTKLTVKQEPAKAEDVVSETTHGLPQVLREMKIKLEPEPTSTRTKKEQHVCLQQTTLQPAQRQITERLLLQQQHSIQNFNGTLENGPSKVQHVQLKQQGSSLMQQIKARQLINQPQKIQIQIKLKQQQVLIQKHPQLQQVSSDSEPTLVTDSNGNHFLIALTNHVAERQRIDTLKATNHVPLQAHNGGVQVSADPRQEAAQCLSAPPGLKPLFRAPSGKNTLSPSSQTKERSGHVFVGPMAAVSSPANTDTEPKDDITDPEEKPTAFKPEAVPTPHCLYPKLSPPVSTRGDTVQREPESLIDSAEARRKDDFLESATEKPPLGEEPGGLLVLIDDFHSQMLCTPNILDHPLFPMETFDMVAEAQPRLNLSDWLDLTAGGDAHEETPTLAPLGPQTPRGIFSADILDSYILE
ncbi:hypothetical protein Q5P01_017605 [Channa striata]|uniref:SAP domain-containing protein n=1 Tax=Channa striata TaxID=64152 RepID=A0AA88MBU3_CHASR|nr:hypothetical protein Q5P01_017605 [Channa striata]